MSNSFETFFAKLFGKKVIIEKKNKKRKNRRDKIRINKLENRVEILINKVVYLEGENKDLHIRDIRNQHSFNNLYNKMKYLEIVNKRLEDKCKKCIFLDSTHFT